MYSSSNYNVWNVNAKEFDQQWSLENKIKFLLRYGILAPSCHNSQPWKFRVVGDSLEIYADDARKLSIADPDGRGLYISLGAYLENIIIAANHFDLQPIVQNENFILKSFDDCHLAIVVNFKIKIEKEKESDEDLFTFISHHKMNKFNYIPHRTFPSGYIDRCHQIIKDTQAKLYIGDSDTQIDDVANLVGEATATAFANKNFRQELSGWLRNNFTSKGDGMPLFTNGLPGWLSFLVPILMPYINPAKPLSDKSHDTVKSSSGFGVLGNVVDDTHAWINIGRSFQRLNLLSYQLGLSLAIMGAPTEVEGYALELKKILNLDFQPMLFFRIGYPQRTARRSPRRNLEDVLIK